MIRKIVKQGLGAYTISLPKKWIDFMHLKSGDEVDIKDSGTILVIENVKKNIVEEKEITIEYNHHFKTIRGTISALYKSGYDKITINHKNEKDINILIQKAVNSLYGYDIFEFNEKKIVIKSLNINEEINIPNLINKMIFSINIIVDLILEDIEKKQLSKDGLIQQKVNMQKYRDLIIRYMSKMKLFNVETLAYHIISDHLFQIMRNFRYLHEELDEKIVVSKETSKLIKETHDFIKSVFKEGKTREQINKNRTDYEELKEKCLKLLKKGENTTINSYVLGALFNAISCISSYEQIDFAKKTEK
jgi:phosphate uptake regulator